MVPVIRCLKIRAPSGARGRGGGLSAASVAVWFHRLYGVIGLAGCSSHGGRRTFITRAARRIVEAGGSLRDVQQLAHPARHDPGLHRRQFGGEAPGRRDDLTRVQRGARHRPYLCWPVWQVVRLIVMATRGHTGASAGAIESDAGPARLVATTQ